MHFFLLILMVVSLAALLILVCYAAWRVRKHMSEVRRPPRPPGLG